MDSGSITGDFPVEDGLETVTIDAPTQSSVSWLTYVLAAVAAYTLAKKLHWL